MLSRAHSLKVLACRCLSVLAALSVADVRAQDGPDEIGDRDRPDEGGAH